jgi:glycosyltransferase involved in cell wall biosynthesis
MHVSRVIFWQNVLSIHQSALVRAIAAHSDIDVWFAYEEDLPLSRQLMGWTIPNYGEARVVDSRNPVVWEKLVSMNDRATVHAFGSYFTLPRAYAAFRRLRRSDSRLVWMTEAFEFHGWRGWLRMQRARWHALREARKAFELIFSMGSLGLDFYRWAWLRDGQLREFGYIVEPPREVATKHNETGEGVVRLVFVGQLVRRKGVDYLLSAVAKLGSSGWRLDFVGDGVERGFLDRTAKSRNLEDRVFFHGNQPNEYALEMIRRADALILPSRWDGWGAVVNEALMVGTPAVVSNSCGAASLIVNDLCGEVFPRGDVSTLVDALTRRIRGGKLQGNIRRQLSEWANQQLSGSALANYFLTCLHQGEHALPTLVPWKIAPP